MNTEEYFRILKKYNISGNPSLVELKSILVNKIKKTHPDKYATDPNKLKYEEMTKELNIDLEIVKKMISGKFHEVKKSQPQSTNTNNNAKQGKTLQDKINDILNYIKKQKSNFEQDDDFKRTLDAVAEHVKLSKDENDYNKSANLLFRTIFFKLKTNFQIKLAHDNARFRNDPYFFYHIYSKYLSEANKLELLDFSEAVRRLDSLVKQYNNTKKQYIAYVEENDGVKKRI